MLGFIALNVFAISYQRDGKYDEVIKTYEESLEQCDDGNLVEMSTSSYKDSCSSYYFSNCTCWDI